MPVDASVLSIRRLLRRQHPNGPGCDPTFFSADVQATPEGDLIQQ
jgi:hypothetical protein